MNENKLSRDTVKKVDERVKRVAKKAGYPGGGELTYQEHLQMKLEKAQRKMDNKLQRQRYNTNLRSKLYYCLKHVTQVGINWGLDRKTATLPRKSKRTSPTGSAT